MIDCARLDQMLSNLEGYLEVLRVLGRVPREEFLANPDKVGNVDDFARAVGSMSV